MTSCQSIRECRKDHKRYKASRIKEGICGKKVRQLKRRCGDTVDNNRMADAEMEAELQGLQAGDGKKGRQQCFANR